MRRAAWLSLGATFEHVAGHRLRWLSRGTGQEDGLASSAMAWIFRVSPLVKRPMMAKTLSSLDERLANEIAFSGLLPESLTISSI